MRIAHLWVPELDASKGGVQAFSHFLQQGLLRVEPAYHWRTFSRHSAHASSSSVWTPLFAAKLLWAGIRERPDLIIASHVNFLPAARLLKQWCGTRYIGVAHGIEVWGAIRASVRSALHEADAIWAVSRYTRDRLRTDQGISVERLAVLPNTFDEARFSPGPRPIGLAEQLGLPPKARVIFSVGRLAAAERYKGFDRVIAALPQIRCSVPDVHYVIAGKGDDRQRLEALARSLGVADRVSFAGFVPTEALCDYYRLCDVFAMPSTGEGFGIVFLEALACGKPVLAGNRDGSTDALADGRFGALVDPLDVGEIGATLTSILKGTYAHPLMFEPEALRSQVVAEFGFERFARSLKTFLGDPRFGCQVAAPTCL